MSTTPFPLIRSTLSDPDQFDAAVTAVMVGVESGSIRNVVMQDVKSTLSHVFNRAWDKLVSDPYFFEGRWESQPNDVYALYEGICIIAGFHDVISASKRVAKSKATGSAVDAMRAFFAEALPLSLAVASLKDKVVKRHVHPH